MSHLHFGGGNDHYIADNFTLLTLPTMLCLLLMKQTITKGLHTKQTG